MQVTSELLPPPRRLCFHWRLFVCLLAGLRKNYLADFHKIRRKGGTWATAESISFWW